MIREREDFHDIKRELVEAIKESNGKIAVMYDRQESLLKTVNLHDIALYGNKVDTTGVLGDLKAIKESSEKAKPYIMVVFAAMVTFAVDLITRVFFHHKE